MTLPSIAIIAPTIGRKFLKRAIASIAAQGLTDQDQVFFVGDGPQPRVAEYFKTLPPQFIYMDGPETKDYGNAQRNHVLDGHFVTADVISWMDDDDIYAAGAFSAIRADALAHPGKVLLYRFRHHGGGLVWTTRGHVVKTQIGGHCIVAPNNSRLGRWGADYCGDFDFIWSTLKNYAPNEAVWIDRCIAYQRPTQTHWDQNYPGLSWSLWDIGMTAGELRERYPKLYGFGDREE